MSALKEASKATLAVFLAIIIGLLIQKAMTDSSHFHNMLLDPKQIIDYIVSSLLSPVGSISPFVILLAVFALMASSFSSLQKLGVAPTVSMEKAPKKKVREEKAEAALNRETRSDAARSPKRNRGHLPPHLPRVERVIELASTVCRCGCGEMTRIGEDVSERLDVIPAQLRVLVTRRPKYAC
ncbi:MAG: IS66 family transposase zinc-finger binding domain-containing protein, partial [Nitrososphaerota archaeon]